ncbi:MAG TPA: ribonuclease R [Xanthobacteraceae bacterium]|nr:ribonuclease R [Xanthobacteraceae bacterium]
MAKRPKPPLPSKADLLAFITERSGKLGNREIARAFGISGADRVELKTLLRELAEEGHLTRQRKRLHRAGTLPPVVVADIVSRDRDGELIAVPSEWDDEVHGPAPKISIRTARNARPRETAGIGDRALLRIEQTPEGAPGGRIIKIIDRAKHRVLGVFRAFRGGGGRLIPVDKKQLGREWIIPAEATAQASDGDLIAADVARERRDGPSTARVKERLGSLKDAHAVSLIAIHAHGLPHVFPRAVLVEAKAAIPADLAGREDWRHLPFVTIDPADAKDHDDAVLAVADTDAANGGGYAISVAIADVAHYVKPDSALDREALLRGNSVYFPDRVLPMLPERISNDLGSLKPGVDRAAVAVRLTVRADGRVRHHTFHRVLIRSVARLHYAQVQEAIDGIPDATSLPLRAAVLEPLYAAYHALKRARDDRSPLQLELPERKILLKPDGTVDRVITPQRLEAHRLIEEFMILANVAAAETLERLGTPLIYRVHDEPSLEKIVALREFLRTLPVALPKGRVLRPRDFNLILARVRGSEVESLVHDVVLRTQAQAEYAAQNYGHFGLNLRRYAHFTSPIRRYADLIVHRALIGALKLGRDGLSEHEDVRSLGEIAARISAAERRAMTAERETNDRLIARFLSDQVGATFQGRIGGVTRAGLFVKLEETGADGFIPAATLGDEYFRYDEARHAMEGESSGATYQLGDPLKVRLVEAVPEAGALRFALLSDDRLEPRPRKKRAAGAQRRAKTPRGPGARPEKRGPR